MSINLPSDGYRQANPTQRGAYINFVLRDSKKISRHTYEVSGVLSESVPGIYILAAVSARSDKGYRLYTNGYAFWSSIAMRVKAPELKKAAEPKTAIEPQIVLRPGGTSMLVQPDIKTETELLPKISNVPRQNPGASGVPRRDRKSCEGKHKPGDTLSCYVITPSSADNRRCWPPVSSSSFRNGLRLLANWLPDGASAAKRSVKSRGPREAQTLDSQSQ
ncbi:MAG: hypothetical protein ACYDCM_02650 [Candidatus Acidiferrales bacterium]